MTRSTTSELLKFDVILHKGDETTMCFVMAQDSHKSTHTIYELPKNVPTDANLNISQINRIIVDGNDGCLDLGGRVFRLLPHCVLQIKNNGRFYKGTLISQETIFVDNDGASLPSMPKPHTITGYSTIASASYTYTQNRDEQEQDKPTPDLDIVGKIYDAQGKEITIRGSVSRHGTPLRYTYIGKKSFDGEQYDGRGISNIGRRARNLGITDCIFETIDNEKKLWLCADARKVQRIDITPITEATPLPFTALHAEDYPALIINIDNSTILQPNRSV